MRSVFKKTITLLMISFIFNPPSQAGASWETSAIRLSGESARVAREAIKRLQKIPKLEDQLKSALQKKNSTETFLALDVISTLKLNALLPEVILAAKHDQSGFFYLTLNTFMAGSSQNELIALYQNRLNDEHSSPPVKMVVLDTFARMNLKIEPRDLKKILNDRTDPDSRSAALYYLRSFLLKRDGNYAELWKEWSDDPKNTSGHDPFSTQVQYLVSELK
jgi:hypothetical protein